MRPTLICSRFFHLRNNLQSAINRQTLIFSPNICHQWMIWMCAMTTKWSWNCNGWMQEIVYDFDGQSSSHDLSITWNHKCWRLHFICDEIQTVYCSIHSQMRSIRYFVRFEGEKNIINNSHTHRAHTIVNWHARRSNCSSVVKTTQLLFSNLKIQILDGNCDCIFA